MSRPLMWVGVAYTLGVIWAAGDQKLFYGTAGIVLFVWITGRIRQPWKEKRLFWLLPVFFVSGFVIFDHAMTDVKDASMENQFIHTRGMICQSEAKEKTLAVTLLDADINGRKKKLLLYMEKDAPVAVGDDIEVRGILEKPERASNPGQFDGASYYRSKGIAYIMRPDGYTIVGKGNSYPALLDKIKKFWCGRYQSFLNEEDAGVVRAVLTGDKAEMDEKTEQLYIQAGIVHVLAISGLHISIIGMSVYTLLKRLGVGLKGSACLSGFIVLSYGVMTGFGPSTERAVIMFLVRMGAVYLGCTYDFLSALSFSALILFVSRPLSILQTGVWFSFAAVLSIGVLWPAIEKCIPWQYAKTRNYKIEHLKKSMGVKTTIREWIERMIRYIGPSAAVTIGTLPLTAFCYGAVPLVGFFMNLLVLPLMNLFVPMALGAGGVSLLSISMAGFCGGTLHFILQINRFLCEKMLIMPFSVWRTGVPPSAWLLIDYGLMIGFALMALPEHKWFKHTDIGKILIKKSWLLMLAGLFILIPIRKMYPMVAFIDVGQGDGIFMRTANGTTWLIDGGSSDVQNVGKYRIIPFMNYYGEKSIDYACVSHGDQDHISGVRELLLEKKIRHLVLTAVSETDETVRELADLAVSNGAQVIYINEDTRWESGGWQFWCLYPGREAKEKSENDQSMVLRVNAFGTTFLFTGDISSEVENVLDKDGISDVDVLKTAHHGSGYSSSEEFLKASKAKMAVISCGRKNRYGHPAPETLERMQKADMQVYITMKTGAVIMPCKKGKFLLQTWLK